MALRHRSRGGLGSPLLTLAAVVVNAVCSIGTLGRSRSLFLSLGFPLPGTVSALQLWTTALALTVTALTGLITLRRLPWIYVIPASFCFGGVFLLQNISLIHNSLLFHCLLRPVGLVLSTAITPLMYDESCDRAPTHGRGLTGLVACACALTVMSVDPQLNWLGALMGGFYVLGSALHESLLVAIQAELGCDYTQLLAYMAPVAAVCLTFLCHAIDDLGNQPMWPRGRAEWELWVVCVYAGLIPVSAHVLTRKLSPLGVQWLGLVKLAVMCWIGYDQLRAQHDWRIAVGTSLCLVALVRYTSPAALPSLVPRTVAKGKGSSEEIAELVRPRRGTDTTTVVGTGTAGGEP